MWRVGQLRPGDQLRFVETTFEEAAVALRTMRKESKEIKTRILNGNDVDLRRLSSGVNQLGNQHAYGRNPDDDDDDDDDDDEFHVANTAYNFDGKEKKHWREVSSGLVATRLQPRPTPSNQEHFRIDLNADCGEGYDDEGLMQHVTSINVACGGHVGHPEMTSKTIRLASEHNVAIGVRNVHLALSDSI